MGSRRRKSEVDYGGANEPSETKNLRRESSALIRPSEIEKERGF
jgi:hypothetical protein